MCGSTFKSVRLSTSFLSGMEWVSTIYQYEIVLIVTLCCHVFAVFWSGERESSEFSLIAMSIQSNLSGSSLEHDPRPLQTECFPSWFQRRQASSCSTPWSPALKAPLAPSFTKIQGVARNKTRKTERRLLNHRRRRRHCRSKRQRGEVGCSLVEPFVGSNFPWHNCHGGAWNKTFLITHTFVRIEWDQQQGPAAKSGFRKLGISRNFHGYTTYIPCIYIKWYTMYIHVYPWIYHVYNVWIYHVYPFLWIYMDISWIYHVYTMYM